MLYGKAWIGWSYEFNYEYKSSIYRYIPISIGIFFVSYFLGIIGKLKDSFNWLKYFSPFDYYDPSEILKDGFEVKFIIIGICVIIISIISSYFIYGKKDMNI